MESNCTKEKKQHSSMYIPYSYYNCAIPDLYPNVPLHWHNEFEISLIAEGTGIFRCAEKTITANAGDIIIILPNTLHAVQPAGSKRLVYNTIVFNETMISGSANDRCFTECITRFCTKESYIDLPITDQQPFYTELKNSLTKIFRCAESNDGLSDLLLKSELLHTLWLLLKNDTIFCKEASAMHPVDSIRPILEYIQLHYTDELSIEQLACISHLSKSYFMCLFRQVTGLSAIEYVNQIRIQAACKLLTKKDLRSSDIAFSCGFRNLSNFNRQFRRFTGFTPMEYRKKLLPTSS